MRSLEAGAEVGIVADRVGYEERAMLAAAREAGISACWIDDGRLCSGLRGAGIPSCAVYLIRSRAYTRGAAIAALLEDRHERTINSSASIALSQNKLDSFRALSAAGVPIVDFRLVLSRADLETALRELGTPLVLKPLLGGLGSRVLLVRDPDLAHAVYDYVEHYAQSYDRLLLAQPFQPGSDLRAIVVDGRVIAAIEREPAADWRSNLAVGARPLTSATTPALRALARRVADVTGVELMGLDVFCDADRLIVGEVNHVPRFRGLHAASGVDVASTIIEHVTASLEPAPAGDTSAWSAAGGT